MGENIRWTPYLEKMMEQVNQLSITEIKELGGKDITPLSSFTSSGANGSCRVFKTEKAEKIGIGSFIVNGKLQCGLCTIFPAKGYDLPVFLSRWEERGKEIAFLVDFVPTVDFLVDEEYRVKYLESMDAIWQRYESLAGICPEENDSVRAVCSIIYTAARVPVEKEGMRVAALAPHIEYLKNYVGFMKSASPIASDTKQREVSRKVKAVRGVFSSYFRECAGKIIGSDTAELLSTIFF